MTYNYSTETCKSLNNLLSTINSRNDKVTEEQKQWQTCFEKNINIVTEEREDINLKSTTKNNQEYVDLEPITIDEDLSTVEESSPKTLNDHSVEFKEEHNTTLNISLQELAIYSVDILNNENEFPKNKFFDLFKEITEHDLQLLMKHLETKLNIEAINLLCKLLAEDDFENIGMFVKILAAEILLHKLKFSEVSLTLLSSIKLLLNVFPNIVIQTILTPIFLEPESAVNITVFKDIIHSMTNTEKQILLRNFLKDNSRNLVSSQIVILEKLISAEQHPKSIEELINLMYKSRIDLAKDISFGRFLVSVAQLFDKFSEYMYIMDNGLFVQTVQCNETIFKKRAMKILDINE